MSDLQALTTIVWTVAVLLALVAAFMFSDLMFGSTGDVICIVILMFVGAELSSYEEAKP